VVASRFNIVLDRLQEKPCCVSSVESSISALIVKIWDQTVPRNLSEVNNRIKGILIQASGQKDSFKTNKSISTPTPHIPSAEMR
jgi:hypothetical protein